MDIYTLLIILVILATFVLNILFIYVPVKNIRTDITQATNDVDYVTTKVKSIITNIGPKLVAILEETVNIENKIDKILKKINVKEFKQVQTRISSLLKEVDNKNTPNPLTLLKNFGNSQKQSFNNLSKLAQNLCSIKQNVLGTGC